ncbi:hypothetical protein F7725_022018, partial [Dissostichus mawsoni]
LDQKHRRIKLRARLNADDFTPFNYDTNECTKKQDGDKKPPTGSGRGCSTFQISPSISSMWLTHFIWRAAGARISEQMTDGAREGCVTELPEETHFVPLLIGLLVSCDCDGGRMFFILFHGMYDTEVHFIYRVGGWLRKPAGGEKGASRGKGQVL